MKFASGLVARDTYSVLRSGPRRRVGRGSARRPVLPAAGAVDVDSRERGRGALIDVAVKGLADRRVMARSPGSMRSVPAIAGSRFGRCGYTAGISGS